MTQLKEQLEASKKENNTLKTKIDELLYGTGKEREELQAKINKLAASVENDSLLKEIQELKKKDVVPEEQNERMIAL